jgi:3-phosphoshikimate 1-carboxyvinyltransferase
MAHPTPIKSLKTNNSVLGDISVPGDKSLSHRALIFGSLAEGTTKIRGLLESEDVLNTAACLRALGADIRAEGEGESRLWTVKGRGAEGFQEPEEILDMGNSGTAARLLCGLVAGQNFKSFISGDHSLNKRPMRRIITPLREMGASFHARQDEYLPMMVDGVSHLKPINYKSPVASAQVKSAILLASLKAAGKVSVTEPHLSRDHTEKMGKAFGWDMDTEIHEDGSATISAQGGQVLTAPADIIDIPSDPSSAAFPIAAAVLIEGSDLTIRNVNINETRIGFMLCLQDMGADVTFENQRLQGGEPVADIRAKFSPNLKGIEVPLARVPSMIDEFPIFSVVASCASGITKCEGLKELRVKESDRLSAMAQGLAACGVNLEEGEESLIIKGAGTAPQGLEPSAAPIKTHYDHRIAMSFLILGAVTPQEVRVDDINAINTSFPIFMDLMQSLGLDFKAITE